MDEIIDRVADILELAGAELDDISRVIFNIPTQHGSSRSAGGPKPDYTAILERIGRCGDLAGKTRESLLSLARVVAFYIEIIRAKAPQELDEHWRTVRSDVSSLTEHDQHRAEHDHQDLLDCGRRFSSSHLGGQHLWHELQVYAGTRMVFGVPVGGAVDDYFRHPPLLVFPAQGMALSAAGLKAAESRSACNKRCRERVIHPPDCAPRSA